jgi:hypothetical protein
MDAPPAAANGPLPPQAPRPRATQPAGGGDASGYRGCGEDPEAPRGRAGSGGQRRRPHAAAGPGAAGYVEIEVVVKASRRARAPCCRAAHPTPPAPPLAARRSPLAARSPAPPAAALPPGPTGPGRF